MAKGKGKAVELSADERTTRLEAAVTQLAAALHLSHVIEPMLTAPAAERPADGESGEPE